MDIVELARVIEERYRRYLTTTFFFRDSELRASFEHAVSTGHLSKGPYLEATPVFQSGQTPRELFQDLLLYEPEEEFLRSVHGDRPLYRHQQEAIQKAFFGRNVIVATGTGSGKTEAFLYPVLLHLYQEYLKGQLGPGVRALILYPMNALANDQRERLGEICRKLEEHNSGFRFSFGQYIGETPEDEQDHFRNAKMMREHALPGELVFRSQMRASPPHILLTNYSMLEYLLLRPADSPLFDGGQARWWRFLVLDEAHQYRGSRGTEMAMLLRRLKERLRDGGAVDEFCCIATSATIAGGAQDTPAVAQFAADLFGEKFSSEDVILGETVPIHASGTVELSLSDYRELRDLLDSDTSSQGEVLARIGAKVGLSLSSEELSPTTLGAILQRDTRSTRFRQFITENPREVESTATHIFPELVDHERQLSALQMLVELLVYATNPVTGTSLLSARYHFFLCSLEGAFISYFPEKKVSINRTRGRGEAAAFEAALCRECGQHYFVGRIQGDKFVEAVRDPSEDDFGVTFLRPVEPYEGSSEKEDADSDNTSPKYEHLLCMKCGIISPSGSRPSCGHDEVVRVVREDAPEDEDRADEIKRCGVCGYLGAGRDPVREIVHGPEGPHVVIATTLVQKLPEQRKKVLAFADSRQQASFFAWYLEDSYRDLLSRNVIFQTVKRVARLSQHGIGMGTLVDHASERMPQAFAPRSADELQVRKEVWRAFYQEFLTDEKRISLEGVGLLRWSIAWPQGFSPAEVLRTPPWSFDEDEAFNLLFILLDIMRTNNAVEIRTQEGVRLQWHDLGLQSMQSRYCVGAPYGRKGVKSWDGRRTQQARFLAKLLSMRGITQEEAGDLAENALRAIWEHLCDFDETNLGMDHSLMLNVDGGRRLNPDWWRLLLYREDDVLFRCETCGRLYPVSVRDSCPRYGCQGRLRQITVRDLEPNHYRILYLEDLPKNIRVEEHTAQLSHDQAREFQREFRQGNIHVLSCSTTFELGVDLGDLDTIFLRNVPPEAFNYAQRVGRSGRRSGYPGFAITFCHRRPHDLYHFSDPLKMINGEVRPPVLGLRNTKIIARHITAVALSAFFRDNASRYGNVEKFLYGDQVPQQEKDMVGLVDFEATGVSVLRKYLQTKHFELVEVLRRIVPDEVHANLGLSTQGWVDLVAGEQSRLALAEAEVVHDMRTLSELEKKAIQDREYRSAEWAAKRICTIVAEDMLSFLSRKAVIPKYGFPVDVVELDPFLAGKGNAVPNVLLQRDLGIAISEYAPTSQVLANKKVWTSYALKRVPEKEWPWRYYQICRKHNVFLQWERGTRKPQSACRCKLNTYEYVVPCFGFVTERNQPEEPKRRIPRLFTTRPYFAGAVGEEPERIDFPPALPVLSLTKASPGIMVVICEGRRGEGFYICSECGAGFRHRGKNLARGHKTALGTICRGELQQVSLGHQFETDVIQLRFHGPIPDDDIPPVWFAYSLAYALVEGAAEVLNVPSTDLSAVVGHSSDDALPPIIIYDNFPGGAGLVAKLEDENALKSSLHEALLRVSGGCGCDDDTSCYGCLRNYRNQFAHDKLQRGPAKRFLEDLLNRWQ